MLFRFPRVGRPGLSETGIKRCLAMPFLVKYRRRLGAWPFRVPLRERLGARETSQKEETYG